MTYDEALAFWYGRINYEVRAANPADLKLEGMRALLGQLGDPHDRLRLVHVTGTKGKGSTAAMLDAVLRAAGYRVGLFTSPHLTNVEERIQVNGVPISPAELAARMAEVAAAVRQLEGGPLPAPTFFEIGTALGFLHFLDRRCDIAVIEVGLGGRFDSTNVCRPLVSVITSVGLDHMAQLGNTLEAIAFEKAGIIKAGVPVVSGVTEPGPRAVIRRVAADVGAPLIEREAGFRFSYLPGTLSNTYRDEPVAPTSPPPCGGEVAAQRSGAAGEGGSLQRAWDKTPTPGERRSPTSPPHGGGEVGAAGLLSDQRISNAPLPGGSVEIVTPRCHYPPMPLGLLGEHQAANAANAVAALECLRDAGMPVSDSAIRVGLFHVRWPARIEVVSRSPVVIVDTAHNVPSVAALVKTLREAFPAAGRKSVVFAVSSDKQYPEMLRTLAGYFDHFHLTKYGNNPRCVPPEQLAEVLAAAAPGKAWAVHPTSTEAWAAARTAAGPNNLVCITGSVFLAGELRPLLVPGRP